MKICVYGASSSAIDKDYIEKVEALGKQLAERGHSLVFGAGTEGLMGAVARGVHAAGGHVTGVIPQFFLDNSAEVLYPDCDTLYKTETMRERKQIMEDNADAFIMVPGGIGTYEEFFEIMTLKQLHRHNKAIGIYNINGFFTDIYEVMENAVNKKFMKEKCLNLFFMTEDTEKLWEYIEGPQAELDDLSELKRN